VAPSANGLVEQRNTVDVAASVHWPGRAVIPAPGVASSGNHLNAGCDGPKLSKRFLSAEFCGKPEKTWELPKITWEIPENS